ncbi:MAG: hypothetical protein ACPGGB_09430, partial [Flavobacteriales bacterium]
MEGEPKHVNNRPVSGPSDSHRDGGAFFASRGWTPFPFQLETWAHFAQGGDGLVNAPTGSGKTYTMSGTKDNPGIMFHTLNDLFAKCQSCGFPTH